MSGTWPRFGVFGAGAVGCYYGGMLARAGAPVTLVGRSTHVDAINKNGLRMDTVSFDERVRVDATVDETAIGSADVILITVKTVDTVAAAEAARRHAPPDALVASLQNGVDNVERMRNVGIDPLAGVVYVAVAMSGPGALIHSGRGDLVIGDLPGRRRPERDLSVLRTSFEQAGIPTLVSTDIRAELWRKLVMNCAYNAVSALTGRPYGTLVAEEETRVIVEAAARETVTVARGLGIDLELDATSDAALTLGRSAMPEATSSTAQDLARGRPTEIDALNGFVARQGERLGIPTPVNRTLYGLVKSLERSGEN